MRYVISTLTAALAVVPPSAFSQPQNYPAGGLGDAWVQDQPTSIGINNGYDPSTGTYTVPHSEGRSTTAMPPRYESGVR
jgi:hypothetical protein